MSSYSAYAEDLIIIRTLAQTWRNALIYTVPYDAYFSIHTLSQVIVLVILYCPTQSCYALSQTVGIRKPTFNMIMHGLAMRPLGLRGSTSTEQEADRIGSYSNWSSYPCGVPRLLSQTTILQPWRSIRRNGTSSRRYRSAFRASLRTYRMMASSFGSIGRLPVLFRVRQGRRQRLAQVSMGTQ